MARTSAHGDSIRRFILFQVHDFPHDIARVTAKKFGISRQAVNRHVKLLMSLGRMDAEGNTRNRQYRERPHALNRTHLLAQHPKEDEVWRREVAPILEEVPRSIKEICEYGFTEMFNNALDHSGADAVQIRIERTSRQIEFIINDNGVGIFHKVQQAFALNEARDAAFELTKGKLTTDPARHSGEGVFFTSRMFDQFEIESGDLRLVCTGGDEWRAEQAPRRPGTFVRMVVSTTRTVTRKDVFDRFSSKDGDYTFCGTRIPLALACDTPDENLISRSQAKRVLARVEEFREVSLDFVNIASIGQAFADEIFRVFARRHPNTTLHWVRAEPEVEQMVRRALHHDASAE